MITIHKYVLQIQIEPFHLNLPKGYRIVLVACQANDPFLWAIVDNTIIKSQVKFQITETGEAIPEGAEHIASFQQHPYVRHLWRFN